MKIGILGGTFNPIHIGHLIIAQQARQYLKLKKIIFIPSYQPPHKRAINLAKANHRYKMVSLAIKGNPGFSVSRLEIARRGKSYTIDTLGYLRKKFGKKTDLFFIIGSDTLPELNTWKDIDKIKSLVRFAVLRRPGFDLKNNKEMININIPGIDISSSQIRKALSLGKTIRYLVPEEVLGYINRNRLYQGK